MSNNDNSLVDRLTTIIDKPPVNMNIPGNQFNRLRKDKSQYDAYVVELKQYLKELESSVNFVDPAIERTFSKLRDNLVKIINSLVKNLTDAKKIVDSIIKNPELVKDTNSNTLSAMLLSKVVQYFNYEGKYAYMAEQIMKIERSKEYQNIIDAESIVEFPQAYSPGPVTTGNSNNNNEGNDDNNNGNNNSNNNGNVFFPSKKKKPTRKNISGSMPKGLVIRNTNKKNEGEVLLELQTPQSQHGGNSYDNNNEMPSAASSYIPKTLTNPSLKISQNRNLPPTFVPNVVKQVKSYLINESRNKNTNRDRLARLELVDSPIELLTDLKEYANEIQKKYTRLNDNLRQNQIKILDILNKSMPKLKRLFYIKENIGIKIEEVKDYIETLGTPFTSKNLYVNKKPKVASSIKLPTNYDRALKRRGYSNTATRRNQNRNTRPWWRRLFTRRQPPVPSPVVEDVPKPIIPEPKPQLKHNGTPFPNHMRYAPLYAHSTIPEKEARFANKDGGPLSTTITNKESNDPIKLLAPNLSSTASAESDDKGLALNWVDYQRPRSLWNRLFRRGPTTVRTRIGEPVSTPSTPTRKWWNPRTWGGRHKTRKVRK